MDSNEIENSPEFRDLFIALGNEISEHEMGFGDPSDEELERSGRKFWKWKGDEIRDLVCTNAFLTRHVQSSEAELLAALTDLLSSYPYLSLIRIVIRIGITRFCRLPTEANPPP